MEGFCDKGPTSPLASAAPRHLEKLKTRQLTPHPRRWWPWALEWGLGAEGLRRGQGAKALLTVRERERETRRHTLFFGGGLEPTVLGGAGATRLGAASRPD